MSTLKAHYVTCDAPNCEEKKYLTPRQYEERHIPFKWIRTRTWDTDGPWEDKEYDVCSEACLVTLFAEAHELRYQFDIGGEEPVYDYEEGND